MQISPPSVKTATDSMFHIHRVSKRRLLALMTTATMAGGLGVAMGSSVRFQVVPMKQTSLFIPQQDFPPLAEWPSQAPSVPRPELLQNDEFSSEWQQDSSSSQLDRSDTTTDIPTNTVEPSEEEDVYFAESPPSEPASFRDIPPTPTPRRLTDPYEPFDQPERRVLDTQPPPVSEDQNAVKVDIINSTQSSTTPDPVAESYPWFDKRPLSETQFDDGPLVIEPIESDVSPTELPENQ